MSKVITFSRTFPSYHPKAGEPTYFVEKLCNSFLLLQIPIEEIDVLCMDRIGLDEDVEDFKHHTVRAGHRFKAGDYFSPRVWSGRPYCSPQIKLSEDVRIAKVWNFHVDVNGVSSMAIPGDQMKYNDEQEIDEIAKNDGLSTLDFELWILQPCFKKEVEFDGQIICWNESIEY